MNGNWHLYQLDRCILHRLYVFLHRRRDVGVGQVKQREKEGNGNQLGDGGTGGRSHRSLEVRVSGSAAATVLDI